MTTTFKIGPMPAVSPADLRARLADGGEIAAGIAGHPPHALDADRRAASEGFGLPLEAGLAVEARIHNLPIEG